MGSGGVSLLYRREKGKTRMGEGTLRGQREREALSKSLGPYRRRSFFPNWEKILLQLEKSILDFELKSDAGRMADRSWEEPFISKE